MGPKPKKIAVLMGGIGSERQVSLESGACVADALEQAGFDVVRADIHPESLGILSDVTVDVFFLALHGAFGEDGCLQEILDRRELCYTGSGSDACRLAFDKMASKVLFQQAGVRTPAGVEFDAGMASEALMTHLAELGPRWVVKPIRQGSSVGVHIVDQVDQVVPLCHTVADQYQNCMIESFVPGREITVTVLHGQALPVIEIRVHQAFYDYQAKYADETTEYLFNSLDPLLEQRAQALAVRSFAAFGLRDFARVDFMVTDSGDIMALEFNTIPGMTSHSLVPKAASRAGIGMPELCSRIVNTAYQRRPVMPVSGPEC